MDPSVEDHSIYFTNFNIHIKLFLYGVLSYFQTSTTSLAIIEGTYEVYLMKPEGRRNPGSDAYTNSK